MREIFLSLQPMPSHSLTFLLSYLRPEAGAGPRRSQSRWAGGRIISIPRWSICPRAPTVPPALLFGPERVKPNQQGYHSAMGPALGEVGGEVVNCRRRVEQEGGCGGLSSEVGWMGTSWSQSQRVVDLQNHPVGEHFGLPLFQFVVFSLASRQFLVMWF